MLLLSFLAALARMSQIFLLGVAELLCWFGSAFAVSETASCKVQRKKRSSRVKANKAPVPAGWRRPSLGRSHVFYLLAALLLCVSAVAGSHASGAAALSSTGEYDDYKAADRQPARSNLLASLPLDPDSDSYGKPDYLDPDSDGDGKSHCVDPDSDGDGIPDSAECFSKASSLVSCSPLLVPALVLILLAIACGASWPTAASGKGARGAASSATVCLAAATACLTSAAAAPAGFFASTFSWLTVGPPQVAAQAAIGTVTWRRNSRAAVPKLLAVLLVVSSAQVLSAQEVACRSNCKEGVNSTTSICGHAHIVPREHARHPILNGESQLASSLWVDGPDAQAVLQQAHRKGAVSSNEAAALSHFIDHGWMVVDLELGRNATRSVDQFFRNAWRKRPKELLAKHESVKAGVPTPMSHFPADWVDPSTGLPHQAGTKILEAHSHSKALSNLLRHPKLFRMVELVLDDVGVATQSLLFSHGSKQALHRDPWFVPTNPASTMLASWVAMEDISPNSGPLAFIPGSHRLPWKLLDGTGDILFADASPLAIEEHKRHLFQEVKDKGLKVEHFVPRRGEAILWHAGLIHGGSEVKDATKTRKSFVVHYDKLRNHPSKTTGFFPSMHASLASSKSCKRIHENHCMYAFVDPMLCDLPPACPLQSHAC